MQQAAATQEDAHRAPLFSTDRFLIFVIAVVLSLPFLAAAFDLVIDPRLIILPLGAACHRITATKGNQRLSLLAT